MKRLTELTRFLKEFWGGDVNAPPYPLTYDEWEGIQAQEKAMECVRERGAVNERVLIVYEKSLIVTKLPDLLGVASRR